MKLAVGRELQMNKSRCKLCLSPDRVYYENLHFQGGESHRSISKRINMNHVSVSNHFKNHVKKELKNRSTLTTALSHINTETTATTTPNTDFDIDYLGMLKKVWMEINNELDAVNKNEYVLDVHKKQATTSKLIADLLKTTTQIDKISDDIRKKNDKEDNIMTRLEIVLITESSSGEYSEIELKEYEMDLDIDTNDSVEDDSDDENGEDSEEE